MNKSQFVDALATRMGGDRKAAALALDGVIDVVQRAVSTGERVALTGFGVFERRDRRARTARNPQTGASIKLKKSTVPGFRAGQGFKDVVSGAKKLPKVATTKTTAAAATKATKTTATKTTAAKSTSKATASSAATPSVAKSTATKATKTAAKAGKASSTAAPAAKATKTAKAAKPAAKTTKATAKSGSRKKS